MIIPLSISVIQLYPDFYVGLTLSVTYLPFFSQIQLLPVAPSFFGRHCDLPESMPSRPPLPLHLPSRGVLLPFFLVHIISYCFTSIHGFNMPAVVSFNLKTSALLIALVLVPIVILCCSLAIALACSEFWSSRPAGYCVPRFCRSRARKRSQSDPERANSTEIPGFSATPSEYGDPVLAREQV